MATGKPASGDGELQRHVGADRAPGAVFRLDSNSSLESSGDHYLFRTRDLGSDSGAPLRTDHCILQGVFTPR
ncbi:hypothetical protein D3C75_889850 [compost metagenome]